MYLWCNIKNYVYVGNSYFLHTYLFLQISNSLKMVDATNKLSRCLHSSCCSNRSKRSMDPENIFGNCAQFRNGKTMYYNGSNPFRVWWKKNYMIICSVLFDDSRKILQHMRREENIAAHVLQYFPPQVNNFIITLAKS